MLEQGYAYRLKMKRVCGLPYKRKGFWEIKLGQPPVFYEKTHYLCSSETAISEMTVS